MISTGDTRFGIDRVHETIAGSWQCVSCETAGNGREAITNAAEHTRATGHKTSASTQLVAHYTPSRAPLGTTRVRTEREVIARLDQNAQAKRKHQAIHGKYRRLNPAQALEMVKASPRDGGYSHHDLARLLECSTAQAYTLRVRWLESREVPVEKRGREWYVVPVSGAQLAE